MKKRIIHIIIIIVSLIVLSFAAFLGWYLGNKDDSTVENGYVINIKSNIEYDSKLLTTYEEYLTLINSFDITTPITKADFNKNDYILDYINYAKDLDVEIAVNITNEGVILTYNLNKEVIEGDKLLLYLIPIDKGLINDYVLINREFNYKK